MTDSKRFHSVTSGNMLRLARVVLCSCGLGLMSLIAFPQGPARFPIPSVAILSAIEDRQWSAEEVQIELPVAMTAAVPMPVLEIQTVLPVTGNQARLRVRCRVAAECLPFLVSASWPTHRGGRSMPPEMDGLASGLKGVPVPVTKSAGEPKPGSRAGDLSPAHKEPTLRAGTIATLVMDATRLQIRLQVVSLGSGGPGDKVRVTTTDHKHTYTAEIVTPTLLKGEL